MCCMRLAGNAGPKKSPKICYLRTIAQLCKAISSQLRHVSTIGKDLLNSNISPTRPHNMVNFGLLTAEIRLGVWGTPERVSCLGSVTAWHSSSGRQPNFVVPCQNKIILKNFSMNIHGTMLQPIAAFVYCNLHAAAAAVASRQTSEIYMHHAACRRRHN